MTHDNGIRIQAINHWPPVHGPEDVLSEILRRISANEEAERTRLRMTVIALGHDEPRPQTPRLRLAE